MELPKCCLPFFEGLRNCEKWESFRVLKIRVFSEKSHLTLSIQKVPYAPQNKSRQMAALILWCVAHIFLGCYANALIIIRLAALRVRSHPPGSPQMYCTCVKFL